MEELIKTRVKFVHNKIKSLIEEALSPTKTKDELKLLLEKLKLFNDRFTKEIYNYHNMVTDPSADEASLYTETQLQTDELIAELTLKVQTTGSKDNTFQTSRLPDLILKRFDGNLLDWHSFWDQFCSSIHSKNISDVDKLNYLQSLLDGQAKRTLEGLETTSKNYQVAIDLLQDRYGKSKKTIDAHYEALSKLKPVQSSSSISECRKTLNDIETHLRVLSTLGEDVNHNHLRYLLTEKFPETIRYELKMNITDDTVAEIRKKLETIISAREESEKKQIEFTTEALHVGSKQSDERQRPSFINRKRYSYENKGESSAKRFKFQAQCIFCTGSHYNDECTKIKDINERKLKLRDRCYNCLARGHRFFQCKAKRNCAHCGEFGSHNRALCPKTVGKDTTTTLPTQSRENTKTFHINTKGFTVLQTAVAGIKDEEHDCYKGCRLLLDCGSQRSYITAKLAKELKLPVEEENLLSVFAFGAKTPQELQSPLVRLKLKTRTGKVKTLYVNVVPFIAHNVACPRIRQDDWKEKIMADDGSLGDQVDLLIGNNYYYSVISTEKVKITEQLFLVSSDFGWILSGTMSETTNDDRLSAMTYFYSNHNAKLNAPDLPLENVHNVNLKALWDLESLGITDSPKTTRDEEAIKNFNETTKYEEGRYYVSWPWSEYPPNLPNNFGLAYGRLVNLIKRSDNETLIDYNKTIQDQLEKGVIETLSDEYIKMSTNHPIHYLPHHGVAQPGKPIRIVYDASAKTKDNKSLNECLYCGPLMLEDLTGLLLRFRTHHIGITADVEKAFLQVGLQQKDRDVTRFLWLKDISKPAVDGNILHLRFCRIPFGLICSPFILNATIKQHLSEKENLKDIIDDIYVDNLVTGSQTVEDAKTLYKSTQQAFNEISMNLREWSSNSSEFIESIEQKNKEKNKLIKVLGLGWKVEEDQLVLRFNSHRNIVDTKRKVLKLVASIYDPCGFAVPLVLPAKIFLQDLWKEGAKWDSIFDEEHKAKWAIIANNLENLQSICIPRRYFPENKKGDYQLHCFTDASMEAYAAAVYLVRNEESSFVMGKSRLVPIKDKDNLKIPRLELLGALIGSRLVKYVERFLHLPIKQQFLWTDSQIVLSWCNSTKLLPPFVARRVTEIKSNKSLMIRYVPSELNPADTATRPHCSMEDFERWLKGPDFLNEPSKSWPKISTDVKVFAETGEGLVLGLDIQNKKERQSARSDDHINEDSYDSEKDPELDLLKRLQAQYFPDEVRGKETSLKRNLKLFMDKEGVLRCEGRMMHADLPFDKKYPILIPRESTVTEKIIQNIHNKNYHVGVSHTLSIVRQKYWIPKGRAQIQKVIRKCPQCVKHCGGPYQLPPTPALPSKRVNYSAAFTYTGIDYFGPLYVITQNGKEKRWVFLATCLAVRAVHLEVVQDLTAEECLLALRRFIATRGTAHLIVSDNALQFKLISEVLSNEYCKENYIQWKFICAMAPWNGGFYERMGQILKLCLFKSISKFMVNSQQLVTIIKEIEAVINTRPLTYVGAELEIILRPVDFLSLGHCVDLEPSNLNRPASETTTKSTLIEGWKRGKKVVEEFKDMFINQYLLSLRERYQHSLRQPRVKAFLPPTVGQVVQIKGDSKNRETWRVGKITALIEGEDNQCRVAKVRVGDVEYTRSIAHLYPLEVEETTDTPDSETNPDLECQKSTLPVQVHEPELSVSPTPVVTPVDDLSTIEENLTDTAPFELSHNEIDMDEDVIDIDENDAINVQEPIETRQRRHAATKARERITEWTRNLVVLL